MQYFLNKDSMMLDHSVPRLVLNVAKAVCIVFNSWNISHRIKAHSQQMVPKSHVFKLYKCQKRCLILLLQGISKEDRKNLQAKQATKLLVCSVWNGLTKVTLNNRLDIVVINQLICFYFRTIDIFLVRFLAIHNQIRNALAVYFYNMNYAVFPLSHKKYLFKEIQEKRRYWKL